MRRSTLPAFGLLFLAATVAACGPPGFEEQYEITKLRTLAIGAEPAALGPGEVVSFSALVVNPASPVPPTLKWEVCLLTDSPDNEYRCLSSPEFGDLGFELGEGSSQQLPYDVFEQLDVDVEALCALFGSDEVPDFVSLPSCDEGLPVTIRLTAESEGDVEIAIREFLILDDTEAARDDRNTNPQSGNLLVNDVGLGSGEPVQVFQGGEEEFLQLSLEVDLTTEAQSWEPVDPDNEGQRLAAEREVLRASWFSTLGEFEYAVTYYSEGITEDDELITNELRLPRRDPDAVGSTVRVWVVLRDNRGGVSWKEWSFVYGGYVE